ncbi:hypothetical protein FGO68_gene6025 [Halteria grandinella]|uniref:Uncharacterized protein n=1 Tax=Halteria grandinella TaxID=5974 RepID=A0A8J8P7H9_HALGN|nr:hypothetical protein FGO68_gene6025 [Halteria grandinella]
MSYEGTTLDPLFCLLRKKFGEVQIIVNANCRQDQKFQNKDMIFSHRIQQLKLDTQCPINLRREHLKNVENLIIQIQNPPYRLDFMDDITESGSAKIVFICGQMDNWGSIYDNYKTKIKLAQCYLVIDQQKFCPKIDNLPETELYQSELSVLKNFQEAIIQGRMRIKGLKKLFQICQQLTKCVTMQHLEIDQIDVDQMDLALIFSTFRFEILMIRANQMHKIRDCQNFIQAKQISIKLGFNDELSLPETSIISKKIYIDSVRSDLNFVTQFLGKINNISVVTHLSLALRDQEKMCIEKLKILMNQFFRFQNLKMLSVPLLNGDDGFTIFLAAQIVERFNKLTSLRVCYCPIDQNDKFSLKIPDAVIQNLLCIAIKNLLQLRKLTFFNFNPPCDVQTIKNYAYARLKPLKIIVIDKVSSRR